ncbi:MAG: nuclear transport factor 2 family protein [Acidimicrobiaceae bacterium]|jgi:hypothetical protein|nr:nuclear transport factor 2 family protein [Acidimicrobiaceae bacterium]
MSEEQQGAEAMLPLLRFAFESADLSAIGELLDPNVRWGAPDDPAQSCQTRGEVLAWYQRGRDAGVRAQVVETDVRGDKILVGLRVTGRGARPEDRAGANRWQVLTVGGNAIVEIVGFDDRDEAVARLSASTSGPCGK